jgi:hypothetical protein
LDLLTDFRWETLQVEAREGFVGGQLRRSQISFDPMLPPVLAFALDQFQKILLVRQRFRLGSTGFLLVSVPKRREAELSQIRFQS